MCKKQTVTLNFAKLENMFVFFIWNWVNWPFKCFEFYAHLCTGLCSPVNWPITFGITTMSDHTSARCATRRLLMWETCRSTLSFTQVRTHSVGLWSFNSFNLLIFSWWLHSVLSQGRNRSSVINVVEGSTGLTICAPTSRPSTTARPAWSGWW